MSRKALIFLFVSFLFSLPFDCAYAMWMNLTEGQTKQAVEYGRVNKDKDMLEFLNEWVVVGEGSVERVGINTKFSLVALAAREAALQNRELTPGEIEEKKAELDGILSFQAVLYGPSPTFAQPLGVVLEYKDKFIIPVRKQNAKRATPSGWRPGQPPLFRAICLYEFPDYFVDPTLVVTLVIFSDIESERRFRFELSGLR